MKWECPNRSKGSSSGHEGRKKLTKGRASPSVVISSQGDGHAVLTASHIAGDVDKGQLLYLTGLEYSESVDLLVDTGASNSFAPRRLVQALQLPIAECKRTQISMPDGLQLTSSLVCKVPSLVECYMLYQCALLSGRHTTTLHFGYGSSEACIG